MHITNLLYKKKTNKHTVLVIKIKYYFIYNSTFSCSYFKKKAYMHIYKTSPPPAEKGLNLLF